MKLPKSEPCPFCGHKPKRLWNHDRPDSNIVRCLNHNCPAPVVPGESAETMEKAILLWNDWAIRYRQKFAEEIKWFRKRFKEDKPENAGLWRIKICEEVAERELEEGRANNE